MILTRRSAPPVVGALLTALLLTSCGFNQATNRVNQITNGTTARDDTIVDVVNALVVAAADDSGTLHAQLVNNDDEDAHTLLSVTGEEVEASELAPLEVAADDDALLSEAGIRISGDFMAGEYVTITLDFGSDEQVELSVPVVEACNEYEDLDDAPRAGGERVDEQDEYDCETAEAPDAGH